MDEHMKHIVLLPNTEKDSDYRVTILAAEVLKKAGAVIVESPDEMGVAVAEVMAHLKEKEK